MEKTELRSELIERFFSVICAGLEIETDRPVIRDEELPELILIAKRQAVLPIFYHGIQRSCASKTATVAALRECANSLYRFVQQDQALKKIKTAFDSAGIPYLPLKGATLRSLYPEAWLRTCSDIDILIHAEDLQRAVAILADDAGFSSGKISDHDISLFDSSVHLELHYQLTGHDDPSMLKDVWRHSQKALFGCCYEMEPEFMIVYLLAHMSRHLKASGLGVRPFIDIYLLLNRTEYDEKRLREMCIDAGLLKFYEASKALVMAWFEGEPHTALTKTMEYYTLGGGVFGSAQTSVYAQKRKYDSNNIPVFNYCFRRAFLSREQMVKRFPELKSKPWLLPLRHAKRFLHGFMGKRKVIKAELETAQKQTQESIEFSKFLDELEL